MIRMTRRISLSYKLAIFLMINSLSVLCVAAEKIQIITYEIEGLHQADKMGKYDRILTAVLPQEFEYEIQVAPPKRALRKFEQCSACCLSPMNDNPEFYDYAETLNAIQLPPFNSAVAYLFSQKDKQPIQHLEQLAGKTIGLQSGMSFGNSFIKNTERLNIKSIQVQDFDSLFKMLELNRVDAVAAYTPDALLYFYNRNVTPFSYAKDQPIIVHEDALLCKNISKDFMNKFQENINKFKNTAEFKQLFEITPK